MSYNVKTKELKGGSKEKLAQVMQFAPFGTQNLERVISTYSAADEISFGSRGARTINYYYNVGGKHTPYIPLSKFLPSKKREIYGPIWGQVKARALEGQIDGTRDSLQRLTKYLYKILPKEKDKNIEDKNHYQIPT